MRITGFDVARLLVLASGTALLAAGAARAEPQAISATVTGNVQQVGFRAMIQKQAIKYNLAGSAQNNPDGTVIFSLQGDGDLIKAALRDIRAGTKRSSHVKISPSPAELDPDLATFTVVDWSSTTRQISNPYKLVFTLRDPRSHNQISDKDAEVAWCAIVRKAVDPADSSKLRPAPKC